MSIRNFIFTISFISAFVLAAAAARADDCPVRVTSVVLEGKGIAGHVYRYRVVLSATSSDIPDMIGLRVDVAGGRPMTLPALRIHLDRDGEIYDDVLIFERPAQNVLGAAVESSGTAAPCSSPTVRVGEASDFTFTLPTVVMTLDDSRIALSDVAFSAPVSVHSEDGIFISEGILDYPLIAQQMNMTGQVRVGVRLGPAANVEKAWIVNSSGAKVLDDAALAQARHSTYSAAIVDGIPVEEDYFIIDEFMIESEPPYGVPDMFSDCPAALDVGLATGLLAGSAYWYHVDTVADSTNIDVLSVEVGGSKAATTALRWSPVIGENSRMLQGQHSRIHKVSLSGALFWPGDALSASAIRRATIHSKKPQQCSANPVPIRNSLDPDTIVATAETDRPWLTSPVLESVVPARFATLTWPKYSPSVSEGTKPLSVIVSVHVTQSGEPIVAYLDGASIAPNFAAAALSAAMASTYVVPRTADGAPLTQTFDITYLYVPASSPAGKPVGLVSHDRSDGNRRRTPHD